MTWFMQAMKNCQPTLCDWPSTLLWYSADPSTQDQEKGIYFNNRATFIKFFFQEGLVEEKGRNAFVFTGKYVYIS